MTAEFNHTYVQAYLVGHNPDLAAVETSREPDGPKAWTHLSATDTVELWVCFSSKANSRHTSCLEADQ